jgi:hypothetical protein
MAILRYAGFAPEVDDITDTAPAAMFHVDIASTTLDAPTSTQMEYAGGMGRGRILHRPGFYAPSGNVVYAHDIRTVGWFLYWAFGGYVYTEGDTTSDLNTHEIFTSVDNMLPAFCARLGKDYFEHVFRGCVMNSVEIAVDNQFAQMTGDIVARRDQKETILDKEDLLLPDEYPLAFHEVTATRNGSDISPTVNSLTLTVSNSASVDSARHIGSRFPGDIPVFEREVNISATLKYRDTLELERFWGASDGPADDGQEEFAFGIRLDAGDDGELELAMPRCIYDAAPIQPSGRGEVTQNVVIHAYQATHVLADSTTEVRSEILATLQNNETDMDPAS